MTAMLRLANVSRRFGGLIAVNNVSFELRAGEIVGLIGPNGAGKTTLVNLITGVHRAGAGEIWYGDERIDRLPPDRIARLGIARTFQVVQPFPLMTVLENVTGGALFAGGVPTIGAAKEKAMEHLTFTGLSHLAERPASSLTLANRKRLELAKSLATNPRLLLLDEVNAGLNAAEIDAALDLIRAIAARGITILLIEHVMKVVLIGHEPGAGAASWRADRRRHPRQRHPRSARDRSLSRVEVCRAIRSARAMSLLSVENVTAGYGDVQVLWGIDLRVEPGEIVALIGSNGVGKSTLLRTISGLLPTRSGRITLGDADIGGLPPDQVVAAGIIHVPEGRRLFAAMNVRDNLLMGAYHRRDGTPAIRRDLDFVFGLFPRLYERRLQDASTLSGGEQQMCAIARGLMAAPRLLMIDELSLGLAPRIVEELSAALLKINATGLSMLVVEQDVLTALDLSHQAFVMVSGRVTLSGPSKSLADNPVIREAYLGVAPVAGVAP